MKSQYRLRHRVCADLLGKQQRPVFLCEKDRPLFTFKVLHLIGLVNPRLDQQPASSFMRAAQASGVALCSVIDFMIQ